MARGDRNPYAVPNKEIMEDSGTIYHDGSYAYEEGVSSTENPYEYDTDEYVSWDNGWNDAYTDTGY